jgi:hypothetical protein
MGAVVETTIHQMTMAQMHAIPIDVLTDSTSEVLKTFRLWFAIPAGVAAAIRKMGDG